MVRFFLLVPVTLFCLMPTKAFSKMYEEPLSDGQYILTISDNSKYDITPPANYCILETGENKELEKIYSELLSRSAIKNETASIIAVGCDEAHNINNEQNTQNIKHWIVWSENEKNSDNNKIRVIDFSFLLGTTHLIHSMNFEDGYIASYAQEEAKELPYNFSILTFNKSFIPIIVTMYSNDINDFLKKEDFAQLSSDILEYEYKKIRNRAYLNLDIKNNKYQTQNTSTSLNQINSSQQPNNLIASFLKGAIGGLFTTLAIVFIGLLFKIARKIFKRLHINAPNEMNTSQLQNLTNRAKSSHSIFALIIKEKIRKKKIRFYLCGALIWALILLSTNNLSFDYWDFPSINFIEFLVIWLPSALLPPLLYMMFNWCKQGTE